MLTTDVIMKVFPAFLLVLCRISAFFAVAPVFSTRNVPKTLKIGLAFFVSVIVFLTVGFDTKVTADATYLLAVFREVLAGLLIGYVSYLFFAAVQTSGAIMDLQIGFGISNIVDPLTGVSAPMLGNLKYMLTILVFLTMNGHHYLLAAIMDSYQWLPLDNALYSKIADGGLSDFLVRTFADTFMVALQISAPIVVAMLLTDVGLGLLARTAPQYNVFVIGIPVKILVGLALLIVLLPGFSALFQMVFDYMFRSLHQLFTILKNTPA
ncbi:flagellar type III secretion system protein FliR [Cohnella sp. CFH 77786]|uniref:flagellar biosynthetic protein FliR n=1 Tax=Cohnella sp. CFH 77786 TaxID=2662265 RepID=UPI001C610E34|nr:flagellar biosynthetic protein FliR [Cohnella sp. CFH 77786]MBW5444560.1 flagellar type III secretion system protein FliR [Cohnella sp. CFH 77786]